ncbi:RNB domain-containing ribonuclease [Yimella sp. cx-573]|nr:RNB domain-containing ribonuclease [Yimella sp. cx-573]
MVKRVIRLEADHAPSDQVNTPELSAALDALRERLELPGAFTPQVEQEAVDATKSPQLPDRDESAVPFFTIDPIGSVDLDQAMCLERDGDGYRVRYAIADVPAFVKPGGELDAETHRRGQTVYLPGQRIPLHPTVISEDAASLLEGQTRPAFVWDMRLDSSGKCTAAEVYRATVRSQKRLDYDSVQQQIDAGDADEFLKLLQEIGEKRIELERQRGGASLPMPEQIVNRKDDGTYELSMRPPVPAEDWNAQISLLTGMAAADLMLQHKVGVLRTMPEPDANAVARFKREASALGAPWAGELSYGEFLRTLDRSNPRHLALIYEATGLFRGAAYTSFDGELPQITEQAAVAAPYAHVTAPLRRLVDRYGLAICVALSAGEDVPQWARDALPTLPEEMKASDSRTRKAERAATDIVEAAVLQPKVGQSFEAVIVDDNGKHGILAQLTQHAVVADVSGSAEVGSTVQVELVSVDIPAGKVEFTL